MISSISVILLLLVSVVLKILSVVIKWKLSLSFSLSSLLKDLFIISIYRSIADSVLIKNLSKDLPISDEAPEIAIPLLMSSLSHPLSLRSSSDSLFYVEEDALYLLQPYVTDMRVMFVLITRLIVQG